MEAYDYMEKGWISSKREDNHQFAVAPGTILKILQFFVDFFIFKSKRKSLISDTDPHALLHEPGEEQPANCSFTARAWRTPLSKNTSLPRGGTTSKQLV
ncbi:hypothetical protein COLO4_20748 [Corchorus olitorius]|uniref:Uncharacterized protein n=1 Tax=Corchorus olitorius TaxID=93759 RepID=A0A1R3IX86_9ROSI|nr:hypothetical protein COLO4_20748 [Corchorus olitorius]